MNRLICCLRADGYALTRRRFIWLLPLCLMVLIIMDSADIASDMLKGYTTESIWYFYFQSFSFGGLYGPYLGPMLCTLPYAGALAVERRTGAYRSSLPRAGRTPYFLSKYLCAVFSGAVVYSLGIICLVLLGRLAGLPYILEDEIQGMENFCYFTLLQTAAWRYYLVAAWYAFLSGGLYGGIAALVATRTTQIGVVVVAPMVFVFIEIRLCQLLYIYDQYRLARWLVMRTMPPGLNIWQSVLLITALCLALSALLGTACVLSGRRAMRNA